MFLLMSRGSLSSLTIVHCEVDSFAALCSSPQRSWTSEGIDFLVCAIIFHESHLRLSGFSEFCIDPRGRGPHDNGEGEWSSPYTTLLQIHKIFLKIKKKKLKEKKIKEINFLLKNLELSEIILIFALTVEIASTLGQD